MLGALTNVLKPMASPCEGTEPSGGRRTIRHQAVHVALGQRAEAHRAVAEQYILLGSPMSALDQLRRGQRAGDNDFYAASTIDARIREIEPDALREFDARGAQLIWVEELPDSPEWEGMRDRLMRAAAA